MQPIDALICPRWTVRVEPHVLCEEGLAVAIDDGRVIAVLPVAEAENRFAPAARHDRPSHVALPGLVNAHTHAAMTLLRGFADDLPLERWLKERIWPTEARWLGAEFVAAGTRLAIAEMLRGGTTCFADMYYYPDVVAEVALELGMRAVVGLVVVDMPSAWASDLEDYLRKGIEVYDRFKSERLVTASFAPHAPYTVGTESLRRVRRLADELDVPIHMHVHETESEIASSLAETRERPLAHLDTIGLVTPSFIGVHATRLEAAEVDLLARAAASIVHCPRSNLKLASGLCPVAALQRAGVNVALGTDGAASNNRLDLWAEMQTAALLGKVVADDASALPASTALAMATIHGARALGLAEEIGSLVPGKSADVICVDLSGIEHQPVLDPLSELVYAASRHDVTDVWVAGEHLVAQREFVRLDSAAICAAAEDWAKRLRRK